MKQVYADIQSEREILGGLILAGSRGNQLELWAVCEPLSLEDFYREDSRQLWATISSMMREGLLCDLLTLEARLIKLGKLQDLGGLSYLGELCIQSYATHEGSMKARVDLVLGASKKRRLQALAQKIEQGLADGRESEEIALVVSGELERIENRTAKHEALFIAASALIANPQPIAWLIKGVMEQDSTIMLFGKSGDGKSFIALSMACSIASGLDWYGHSVEQGTVAYIAGEGIPGIKRRVAAWCQAEGVALGSGLYVARHALVLPEEVNALIHHLRNMPNLRLVVLDTVQRTIGGDENNTKDAASYIRALDAIREALPGVSVMMVHHSGHAEGRARGSVVFKASSDLEMMTTRDAENRLVLSCTKAKEAEPFKPMAFQFFTVGLLGWGDADNPVTSAVLHQLETVPPTPRQEDWRKKIRGGNQTTAMTILETMASASDTGWVKLEGWAKETLSQTGIKKTSRFHNEVSAKLEDKGFIKIDEGHVCLLVGQYAREELREEQGRNGKNWEEFKNQVAEERAELGREVYIPLPILPSSTQENEFCPKPEYAEVHHVGSLKGA